MAGPDALVPACPVHGQMHDDFALDTWNCGDCSYSLSGEDLEWQHVPRADWPAQVSWNRISRLQRRLDNSGGGS